MGNKIALNDIAQNVSSAVTGDEQTSASNFWKKDSGDMKVIGDIAIDGYFFNWTTLQTRDAWSQYSYQFDIHDGDKSYKLLTMPLSPQSINISVPTAVTTTVTMEGITEEHNDAPLRTITITGTTGIMPGTGASFGSQDVEGYGGVGDVLGYAFKNTIQAAQSVAASAERVANAFSTEGRKLNSPLVAQNDLDDETKQSGFSSIHNMTRFFDLYLAAKKQGAKKLFLSFYMHKDSQFYDCTLNNYTVSKAAGTLEYTYTLSLTAWRRRPQPVGIGHIFKSRQVAAGDQAINPFARINQALTASIDTVENAASVFRGVSQDFDTVVMGPIKQVQLLVKSVQGLAVTANDFSDSVGRALWTAVLPLFRSLLKNQLRQSETETLNDPTSAEGDEEAVDSQEVIISEPDQGEVEVPPNAETTFTPPPPATDSSEETNDYDPSKNRRLYKMFDINELELTEAQQMLLDDAIEAALSLTSDDVRRVRSNMSDFVSNYSETLGGGSTTYNRVNNRGTVASTNKKLSVNDIVTLSSLEEGMQALDSLSVLMDEQFASQNTESDYGAFYAEMARTNGVDFNTSASKFYVPFEFGATLEKMAVKYLGDVDRWIEIAAINTLKAPYVDEIGRTYDFLGSGAGNSFTVSSPESLYIGQIIELNSDFERPEPRKVKSIDVISSIETLITVDGESDLARFTIADNAKMKYYLPHTVNSNTLIAIPSDSPVNIPGTLKLSPDREDLDFLTVTAKADFMLNFNKSRTADLAFSGSDIKIARGMTNLIQAANIKVLTPQGDLINNPAFGNPVQVGTSTAEVDVKDVISQLSNMFADDPRFTGVVAGRVRKTSVALSTDLVIGMQSSQAYLPFTAELPLLGE